MIRTTLFGQLGQTTPMTCDYSSSVELGFCILPSPTSGHLSKSTFLVSAKLSKSTSFYQPRMISAVTITSVALPSHNCLDLNDMPSDGCAMTPDADFCCRLSGSWYSALMTHTDDDKLSDCTQSLHIPFVLQLFFASCF